MEELTTMITMSINSKDFRIFAAFLKIEIMIKSLNVNLLSRLFLDSEITNFPNGRF